ncbi:threonine/homoserine/homoserine lactone efflux protein [Variovorax boronicumulans]|uniref:Threonine/homoserine/homoserine lactone efflux protein n=1 Tax=Variovorax boronicumulans TaxID=436515 RepID=A0AAW8D9Y4_9BURK|nr:MULTISPECIES: LysE family translocator [Variovorax]MDP9896596.1 threonine/homoserine/homoserine lactone efflux protein [Variovorax boronicumulans]MDQ0034059.1 threonine/homoserine/homoserine lactone efflux protein [Variovorax boronicumulans]MDQ0056621.1 threonine/homoserine/homoserine lactone efflux protein [Variovorax boronicumulans]MDQ0612058.1 threonine/homoserine/homoserine lactone efflux protein [Variovorax sp. W1I1]
MMDTTLSLLGIAGAMTVGAMSPGPSFVMVARTAVASRSDGLAAALGMGAGGLVFAIAALAGLQAAFLAVPGLYLAIKGFGGAYLIYLGFRIWRGARQPLAMTQDADAPSTRRQGRGRRTFLLGLATQVSNPKTAVVYASIFAAFLPREVPLVLALAVPAVIFCIETGWYAIVALALSSAAPRSAYLRYKVWIDRAAGGVMGLLGLRLVWSAVRGN